jgi:hypothetical protein
VVDIELLGKRAPGAPRENLERRRLTRESRHLKGRIRLPPLVQQHSHAPGLIFLGEDAACAFERAPSLVLGDICGSVVRMLAWS